MLGRIRTVKQFFQARRKLANRTTIQHKVRRLCSYVELFV